MGGARRIPHRRAGVGAADRQGHLVNDRIRDAFARGDAVERRVLVEPPHVDDPFDDFALAANLERRASARNGKGREVNRRRIGAIDGYLCLAGGAALVERREIHEREPDRPLDLVGVGTSQKHDGGRRVDTPDRLAQSVRFGIGEKAEHCLLQTGGTIGSEGGHWSSTGYALLSTQVVFPRVAPPTGTLATDAVKRRGVVVTTISPQGSAPAPSRRSWRAIG